MTPKTTALVHRILMALVALSSGRSVVAEPPAAPLTNFPFRRTMASLAVDGEQLWIGTQGGGVLRWNTVDGSYTAFSRVENCLADNFINDIAVDPTSGDVWAATNLGLCQLAAGESTWIVHDTSSSGLTDDLINAVEVDAAGGTWIGTWSQGVFHFDGVTWTNFNTANSGLSDNLVTSILIDLDGNKWFAVFGDSVDRFDGVDWTNFDPVSTGTPQGLCQSVENDPSELGLISFFAELLAVDPHSGDVWIRNVDDGFCLLNGVTRFDGQEWATYTAANSGLASNQVSAAVVDEAGRVWLANPAGISRLDGDSWTTLTEEDGLPDTNLFDAQAMDGDVWFAGFDGLLRYRDGRFTSFRPEGLPAGVVRDVAALPDGDGAWFATQRGLARLDDGEWTLFDVESGALPADDVRAVEIDSDGRVWAGTRTAGVARFDAGRWEVFDTENSGLASNDVSSIAVDINGDLWFGSEFGGLSRFGNGSWTVFTPGNSGLVSSSIHEIAIDARGGKWFGTGRGLSFFDGAEWTTYTRKDGLPADFIVAVSFGSDDVVWAGTFSAGIGVFDGESWTAITAADGLPHDSIRALAVGHDGDLLAGTWGGGLGRFDGEAWESIDIDDGLINDRIYALDVDAGGRVWIATDFGASRLGVAAARFRRGDANCDGDLALSDAVYTFRSLFSGGPAPCCLDAADSSDQGDLNISSGIYSLRFLFAGGAPLPPPGPVACGVDPTADDLDCLDYPGCDS